MDVDQIGDALMTFVESGDRTDWDLVVAAIREGRVLVEVGATQVVIRPAPAPALGKLAARLRELRRQRGVTLQDLMKEIDVSTSAIARLLNAQTLPSWPIVAEVARALGADPEEFKMDYRAAKAERTNRR